MGEAPLVAKPAQHKIPNLGMASITLQNLGFSPPFVTEYTDFSQNSVPGAARSLLAEWEKLSSGQRIV